MKMYCFQCQETGKNGCLSKGACGKDAETSALMDLLIYVSKGISVLQNGLNNAPKSEMETGRFLTESLFITITNANFDKSRIIEFIKSGIELKNKLIEQYDEAAVMCLPDSALWHSDNVSDFYKKASVIGIKSTTDEDIRSLRETLIYGLKGIAAYAHHASVLGYEKRSIYQFMIDALDATVKNLSQKELTEMVIKAGHTAVDTMSLLDKAHTTVYGHPEISKVNVGVRNRPGILISGHDMKDMEELLKQTENAGVDVYTHGEMLPAHYYPSFKKYDHFAGNYGGSWWKQNKEFESFNGPILMTTNCIIPVRESYRERIFTAGAAGYPGVKHIPDRINGHEKDFSGLIELARKCDPPQELETGEIVGGFAHNQLTALADKIADAVKSGAVKRFIVMAGCDGRHNSRQYYTDVARELPPDSVILTAGCAKYRYNKLNLGDINGIPRVLDAGQCNDSYSLAVIALKLKEILGAADVNELPISFDVAWYEQKAVAVLLALLALGFKNIRLGPTLPAFLSPNVAQFLVENFAVKSIDNPKNDVDQMMKGK